MPISRFVMYAKSEAYEGDKHLQVHAHARPKAHSYAGPSKIRGLAAAVLVLIRVTIIFAGTSRTS